MHTPKIFFVANEEYLTKEIILKLARALSGVDCYLLDADRKNLINPFKLNFEEISVFKDIFVNNEFGNDNHKEKNSWIHTLCKKINPDAIVTFTAANFSFRSIRKWNSDVPIFIIQTSYIREQRKKPLLSTLKSILYNWKEGTEGIAIKDSFFQKGKENIFLLWSKCFLPAEDPGFSFFITGNPRFDHLFKIYSNTNFKVNNFKKALYITQPIKHTFSDNEHDENIRLLSEILTLKGEINLSVKLHPRDKKENYEFLFNQHGERIKWSDPNTDLLTLIEEYDFLFIHFSSVVDIAVVLNVPAFSLDPLGIYAKKLPVKGHYIKIINEAAEIITSINLMQDPVIRKRERDLYLKEVTAYTDGKSFERLKDAITGKLNSTLS